MASGRDSAANKEVSEERSVPPPAIALPKGGGAIRGIGEKFAANPVTGTGSMTVPIATSPGRSGFGPQLSLSYDSGAGNEAFGFGWNLSLPSITRKTDKGLPRYLDAEESDVYILSGAEDLVPVLQPNGSRVEDKTSSPGHTIHRYRPRIEGLFARIERWTNQVTREIHWRSHQSRQHNHPVRKKNLGQLSLQDSSNLDYAPIVGRVAGEKWVDYGAIPFVQLVHGNFEGRRSRTKISSLMLSLRSPQNESRLRKSS
jgi:hypothetical protein